MKIAIFGATGGTGRELVAQALELHHEVTAFARTPSKITQQCDNLVVVEGDILDRDSVHRAVAGQDAVLSALGIRKLNQNTIMSDGTENIIGAMKNNGVKRFICMSSIGVGDSKSQQEQLGWLYNRIVLRFMLKNMFRDKEAQEQHIMYSGLDWTIIRPAILANGPRTGAARGLLSDDMSLKPTINRADVAAFMLWQLVDDANKHKAVSVSY